VGDQGAAVHWDGTKWTTVPTGNSGSYYGVWASASNDVWAAGLATPGNFPPGAIAHWDGQQFNSVFSSASRLVGISGKFAVSDEPNYDAGAVPILEWNGQTWSGDDICSDVYRNGEPLAGVWSSSGTGAWIVGQSGKVYSGPLGVTPAGCSQAFIEDTSPRPPDAKFAAPIWASPSSDEVWVGSAGGGLLRWLRASPSWLPVRTYFENQPPVTIRAVWGSGDKVFGVGDYGSILEFSAGSLTTRTSSPCHVLYGVGGTSPSDVWAVGEFGCIVHITGG
jgi:hypothetical protein